MFRTRLDPDQLQTEKSGSAFFSVAYPDRHHSTHTVPDTPLVCHIRICISLPISEFVFSQPHPEPHFACLIRIRISLPDPVSHSRLVNKQLHDSLKFVWALLRI